MRQTADQNDILDLNYFKNFTSNVLESYEYEGNEPLRLIWTDLEHFETYNEQQGFLKGDELLAEFGGILLSQFVDGVVGKIVGVHYAVLTNAPDVERRLLLVHDILRGMPLETRVEFKAGVVEIPSKGEDIDRLFSRARAACRQVSGKVGNYIGYYTDNMERGILLEDYVPEHLTEALDKGWIYIVYQPIVRTVTGKICGAEALARWKDPVFGMISPGEFIPILERRHLVHKLDDRMVRLAGEDYRSARRFGNMLCPVSINLSRYDFEDGDIFETFEEVVESCHIPEGWFRIEVTESAMKLEHDLLKSGISNFREHGYEVWMDNFGSGASLRVLEEFDFDVVKCDIHFMRDFRTEERSEHAKIILSNSINMAKQLKISTLVMGVENEEEIEYLRSIGCEMLQGFFIGKPQTMSELLDRTDEMEAFSERKYYGVLGAIAIDNGDAGSSTGSESLRPVEPMAVLEYRDRRYSFLFHNAAFEHYVHELGMEDVERAAEALNHASGVLQRHLREFAEKVMRQKSQIRFNVVIRGRLIDIRSDYLGSNPETGAVAVIIHSSLLAERGKSRSRDFEDAMSMFFNVFDRVDLVRRKDGMVVRSYLNTAEYGGIYEGRSFETVMDGFTDKYVVEEDRQGFREFWNIGDIDARAKQQRRGVAHEVFRTMMEDGTVRNKQYAIYPMTLHGQQFLLFAIIDSEARPERA